MGHKPTPEQDAIIRAAASGQSFMIDAGAGTAKTTTLGMLSSTLPRAKVLALAFNKRIVKDLIEALPENFTVKTLNGLGHSAWWRQRGKPLQLDDTKINKLTQEVLRESYSDLIAGDETGDFFIQVRNFVNVMRNNSHVPHKALKRAPRFRGVAPEMYVEDYCLTEGVEIDPHLLIEIASEVLYRSIEAGFNCVIDFDDQIYLSTVFVAVYDRYDAVLVDEAQDLSPANHRQLILSRPSQLIAVGDPKQAIYGFRGADYTSMDNLKEKVQAELQLNLARYPLATTFRCPKSVVARQQKHYPGYRAFETNIEGTVTVKDQWSIDDIQEGAAVICRNNSPLVAMAFSLLRRRRGFTYIGVDMAKNLKSLIKRVAGFSGKTLNNSQKALPQAHLLEKLKTWFEAELIILKNKDKAELESSLRDRKECARMVIESAPNLGKALELCDQIFNSKEPGVTLATGHRAKGLEWSDVWFLDPWRVPSKFALALASSGFPGALIQENNLRYVIETRTKNRLTLFNAEDCIDVDAVSVEGEEEAPVSEASGKVDDANKLFAELGLDKPFDPANWDKGNN